MCILKRSCFLLILLGSVLACYSGDSIRVNSFNSFRLITRDNLWLSTGNSAGLFFNNSKKLIEFNAGTTFKDGDFHRIGEAGKRTQYSFDTKSYLPLGDKIFTSGSFEYNKIYELGARWSGTYDPYRGNPYLLADSLSGAKWLKENYRLTGQMAYTVSSKFIAGFALDYFAAVGAKQKDPRPYNMMTSFKFNPSVLFIRTNYTLGFDLGYTNRKEEIEYNVKRSNFSPTYFMFKGMGFYTKEIEMGYNRFQYNRDIFGGVQLQKNLNGIQSLTEIRANYAFEGIEDGDNMIKEDGGDWKTYRIELNQQLQIEKGQSIHSLAGKFHFFNGDGTEYTQTKVKEGDITRYITISKNLKFTRQTLLADISYNYLKMLNKTDVDWDISVSLNAINNAEKYYYIPEIFTSSYFNISGNAEIQKNFYLGKFQLAPTINTAYISNVSSNLLLSNLQEITNTQRQDVYLQEFGYYTADVLKLGGKFQLGYSPSQLKGIDQINLDLEFDYWKPMELETTSTLISAKVGFVF